MRIRMLLLLPFVPFLVGFDGPQAREALARAFDNLYAPGVLAGVEMKIGVGTELPKSVAFAYGRKRTDGETRTLVYSPDRGREAPRLLLFQKPGTSDRLYVGDGRRGQIRPTAAGGHGWTLFDSDFSYEDFRVRSADDYRIEVLGSDRIDGEPCRVLRLRPLRGPYTRQLVWLSTERPVIMRTDYFDEKGLWKRYRAPADRVVESFEYWIPMQDEMLNLRTGRRTVRRVRNILVGTEIPEEIFTLTQLSRGRLPSF